MMEDCRDKKKRAWGDSEVSDASSPDTEQFNSNSEINSPYSKRSRVDNSVGPDLDSLEAKRIQEDLFDILDDPESVAGREPAIQELDSVMKSFEEEILFPSPVAVDLKSDSGESSQAELGYLLEASDDELGLPPSFGYSDEGKIQALDFEAGSSEAVGFGAMGLVGFEDEIPSYDSLEFAIGKDADSYNTNSGGEFAALGELFDYSDESYEQGEITEFLWRSESLSAL